MDLIKNSGEKTEKLRMFLLQLFAFSLPYDLFYSSIIFMTLCATTLLDLNKNKFKQIPKQVWLFQLVYFLGVIGYAYSFHKDAAGFLLERQLAILLLPVIIPLAVTLDEKKVRSLLTALVISSVCAIIYLFFSMAYTIVVETQMPFLKTAFSGAFFNHQFSKPLGIHAGYLSLYVSLSIFYIVYLFNSEQSYISRILSSLAVGVLFAGLFFLASRNSIIATFFILLFIFPLFKTQHKVRYIIISVISLATCFSVILSVPYLKDRFVTELITDIKPLKNGSYINYNTAEPRVERWRGAIDLIKKAPAIGYGTGDEIETLKTEYIKRGLFISYLENFNAHNQYLSYLLKNGILGICIFLFAFYYYVALSIRHRDFMYLAFLLLLLIGFYTENILDSNKGIVFFALFNTVFGYNLLRKNKGSRAA